MTKRYPMRNDDTRKRAMNLTEAKLALVTAHEHGERDALARALRERLADADALTDFELGLLATDSYSEAEANAPDVIEIATRARTRAFAAVFGAQTSAAAQPAVAALSLRALCRARGMSLAALAGALGLGLDVLSALEAGRIRLASIPRQLGEALGEALDATADQVSAALALNAAPALRRGQPGAPTTAHQPLDFTEAVLMSQSMTPEQRARWLAAGAGQSGELGQ